MLPCFATALPYTEYYYKLLILVTTAHRATPISTLKEPVDLWNNLCIIIFADSSVLTIPGEALPILQSGNDENKKKYFYTLMEFSLRDTLIKMSKQCLFCHKKMVPKCRLMHYCPNLIRVIRIWFSEFISISQSRQ